MDKIIILRHKLSVFGGAELVLVEEVKNFKKMGYDVTVVVFEINKAEFNKRLEGVRIEEIKGNFLRQVVGLRNLIKKINPKAVIVQENGHIHLFFSKFFFKSKPFCVSHMYGSFIWLVGSKLNYSWFYRPKIIEIHKDVPGHGIFNGDIKKKLGIIGRFKSELHAILDFLAVRNFDEILTCSNITARELKKLYGINPKIIAGGVDTNLFNPEGLDADKIKKKMDYSAGDRIIMTVNRLDTRKRIDLLIESFDLLPNKFKNFKLLIIGKGPEKDNLQKLIDEKNIKNVFLLGFVDNESLMNYYLISEIIAYPAWCAWGLVPIEAIAMNKKVVVSSDAAVQEAISGLKDVFVAKPEIKDFSNKIWQALNSKTIGYREYAKKNFDWVVYFKKINDLII